MPDSKNEKSDRRAAQDRQDNVDGGPGHFGRSALPRDGLVERVPVIRRRHAGLDLVEHGYAILAVRHGDHAIAIAKVSNETTAESPIAARVAEVPTVAALAYSQADRIWSHADWRHHFARALEREYAGGGPTERPLNFDHESRGVA